MGDVESIKEELGEISFKLDGIEGNVKSIVDVIKGNPLNPDDKGIIGRIIKIEATQAKMDERLSKLENFNKRVIWIGIGLSLSAGYSFDKILELFKK